MSDMLQWHELKAWLMSRSWFPMDDLPDEPMTAVFDFGHEFLIKGPYRIMAPSQEWRIRSFEEDGWQLVRCWSTRGAVSRVARYMGLRCRSCGQSHFKSDGVWHQFYAALYVADGADFVCDACEHQASLVLRGIKRADTMLDMPDRMKYARAAVKRLFSCKRINRQCRMDLDELAGFLGLDAAAMREEVKP